MNGCLAFHEREIPMQKSHLVLVSALVCAGSLLGCARDAEPVLAPGGPVLAPVPTTRPSSRHDERTDLVIPQDDQSFAPEDAETTRAIRAALVGDTSLPVGAHDVVIVTRAHAVTLRGDVGSASERDIIEAHARSAAGVSSVDNRITITL